MTRKDYIKFARMLNEKRKHVNGYQSNDVYYEGIAYNEALNDIAEEMSVIFKEDNPNFDKDRFLTAAGVE